MAGLITNLIILIIATMFVLGVISYIKNQARQKLIDNPPERAVIELKLPYGVTDANKRMQEFYRRIASQAEADDEMRKEGRGIVGAFYMIKIPENSSTPEARFYIECDPERMNNIKKFIKRSFSGGLAQITIPEQHPMLELMEKVRPEAQDAGNDITETGDALESHNQEEQGDSE